MYKEFIEMTHTELPHSVDLGADDILCYASNTII